MTAKQLFLFIVLSLCQMHSAQQDTIALEQVQVSDVQLRQFSKTLSVSVLNDSVIAKNSPSLTSLLNYNSGIYFKENGLGMVSSASFRGTTAQQTAVIWNGININSQLNGQTDFNAIATTGFDNITVRSGGGSSIYGSSAIGGTVHLNNELQFKKNFSNEFRVDYGEYNSIGINYNIKASDQNASLAAGLSRNSSENDYKYPDSDRHNENGQFNNTTMHAALGYKLNEANYLKLFSEVFDGERHFSGTLAAKSKSKYEYLNSRNLLEWDGFFRKWTSRFKIAFVGEKYKYFENAKSKKNFDTAQAETFISKYDLNYALSPTMALNAVVDYTQTRGFGTPIGQNQRSIGAAALLFRHQLNKFNYEISMRKEITDNYKSPLLFAAGMRFDATRYYSVLVNLSRNFRIPTFNDLYWQGSGNLNLKPESAYQAEIGQQVKFKNTFVSATAYYMNIADLIQWKPASNGNWHPENVTGVTAYGAELMFDWIRKSQTHSLQFNASYSYTISENRQTKRHFIYVPYHKLFS